jgi:hypothetical protein
MLNPKYIVISALLLVLPSCGFVVETSFLPNPLTSGDGNNAPSLMSISAPAFVAGIETPSIDANDNTGDDTDMDGDPISYTCRYDNTIDGVVGSGLGDCTLLINKDGSNPSFDTNTGVFSGWNPPFSAAGADFEFEIVGTDPGFASSSVIFSGTVRYGSPMAWLQGNRTTNSTNINQATAYAMEWSSSTVDTDFFTHSLSVNPERLVIQTAGNYFIAVTIPISSTVQRPCVQAQVRVNGTTVNGGIGESSYIRSLDGHNESSNHVAMLLENLSVNDRIEIYVQATAAAGTVTVSNAASLYAEYVHPDRTIFTATATQTTAGTNLNQATAAALEWSEGLKSTGFTHNDVVNPENITIDEAGDYLVYVNVPLYSTIQRGNIRLLIQDDGTTVPGGEGKQGYIRNQSGHTDSSVHWSGLIHNVAAGSILTIKTEQEAGSGTISVQSSPVQQYASLFIEKIDSSMHLFSSNGTRLAGPTTDWNPASALNILWENDVIIDTNSFTHSDTVNPEQVTVNNDGDYLLIYNDSFTTTVQRANPKITVNVNGSPAAGAETKCHYIRNGPPHSESSGTLVYLLKGLSTGDIVTLNTQQEGNTGAVDDTSESLLVLWRKQ